MLFIIVGLVLVAAACAVVLTEAAQSVLPVTARAVPIGITSAGVPTDWRGAALNAHTDSTNLQFAIVAALETDDTRHRDSILRHALRETGSRVPVRVAL